MKNGNNVIAVFLANALLSGLLVGCSGNAETNRSASGAGLNASPQPRSSETANLDSKKEPDSLYTLTEGVKYKEYDKEKGEYVEKEGVLYETNDIGASKLIDREVLTFIGNRKQETKELLEHSYKLIDAYIIGITEVQGYGDYMLSSLKAEKILKADYEKFKSLYNDELKRGSAAVKKMKTYKSGDMYPWSVDGGFLLKAVVAIDDAYTGAIDNLNWSNTETKQEGVANDDHGVLIDEEWEYENIRQWEAHTRLISGRDVLQRYATWFFGGKIGQIEGVKKDDMPIPKEDASIVPGHHKVYPRNH